MSPLARLRRAVSRLVDELTEPGDDLLGPDDPISAADHPAIRARLREAATRDTTDQRGTS